MILLDHGLYKELDFQTRTNYASLWKGLVFADANAIKEYSAKLGAGEDLYALFAGVLTMRPWNRVVDPSMDHLVIQGDENERLELQVIYSLREKFRKSCISVPGSCFFGLQCLHFTFPNTTVSNTHVPAGFLTEIGKILDSSLFCLLNPVICSLTTCFKKLVDYSLVHFLLNI